MTCSFANTSTKTEHVWNTERNSKSPSEVRYG